MAIIMSTTTSNASVASSRIVKRKRSRTTSALSPAELARKRARDRESQRAIRARTKGYIARLEQEIQDLRSTDSNREVRELLQYNKTLEAELSLLRAVHLGRSTSAHYNQENPNYPFAEYPSTSLNNLPSLGGGSFPRNRNSSSSMLHALSGHSYISDKAQRQSQQHQPSTQYLSFLRYNLWTEPALSSITIECSSTAPIGTTFASCQPGTACTVDIPAAVPSTIPEPVGLRTAHSISQDMPLLPVRRTEMNRRGQTNQEYTSY